MRLEMHAHDCEVSPCAVIKAKELVDGYKEAGYDGIVITNHFDKGIMHLWGETTEEHYQTWIVCRKSFGYEVKDQWQSGTCDIIYFRAGRMWYIGSSCCLCTADGKGRKEDLLSEPAEVRKQQPVFYRRGHNELF